MNRVYYTINESTARVAKEINSFSSYEPGEATAYYKSLCDDVYSLVEQIEAQKPQYAEKAAYMAERYCKKLADHLNSYYRNEAACPSVLVCGAGNFPVAKKKKQNSRRETLIAERSKLDEYKRKIENLLRCKGIILSSDENAIEMLQDKISDLEAEHEKMKAINAYYRKNKTCVGCDYLDDETAEKIDSFLTSGRVWYDVPFPGFKLTNSNAAIKNAKARLQKLIETKEAGTKEETNDFFKVVENTEIMRLQLFFEGKPDQETRDILKKNGFKWSPNNQAWQRQLTDNARYSLKRIIVELTA